MAMAMMLILLSECSKRKGRMGSSVLSGPKGTWGEQWGCLQLVFIREITLSGNICQHFGGIGAGGDSQKCSMGWSRRSFWEWGLEARPQALHDDVISLYPVAISGVTKPSMLCYLLGPRKLAGLQV